MCHNLGAVETTYPLAPVTGGNGTNLIGHYYQWGRKDPIVSTNISTIPVADRRSDNAANNAWDDDIKTNNDPCPDGWRVPTSTHWRGMIDNNTITNVGAWTTNDYSSGKLIGASLFLPAAGRYRINDWKLDQRGTICNYWSSTYSDYFPGQSAYGLWLPKTDTEKDVRDDTSRLSPWSIRCISE
jgi:uncharacterized protein (TIGR02145 family)